MTRGQGRGRPSSIDLLPEECDPIIAWAAGELAENSRYEKDIYEEFRTRLSELLSDSDGELSFQIPSKSSFNRYSMRKARLTRRLAETREIAKVIAKKFPAGTSDDLTSAIVELLKGIILEMADQRGAERLNPQQVMQLAAAVKSTLQASSISTERRRKLEKDIETKVGAAVEQVGKSNGWSQETRDFVIDEVMGRVKS